jgi:hypothetical protein
MRRRGVKYKAKIKGALEIAENAFDELIVRVARIMHVQADLLNSVGKLGTSESNVLESPGNATIMKGVRIGVTARGCEFGFGVNGSGGWLAVPHTCTRKNFEYVLALRKVQCGGSASYGNAEKMMKRTEILHSESGS